MTLYWYSKPHLPLKNWTKFYAAKIIGNQNHKITANIGRSSHQIELENQFTEILSENLPIKYVPDAVEIELTEGLVLTKDNWAINVEYYQISALDEFLKTPDCLFYNFEETDDWIIIKWEVLKDHYIHFDTLRTFREENLILKTQSKYQLL
jgi:hypothetical protein